jgi:hypothetical protein
MWKENFVILNAKENLKKVLVILFWNKQQIEELIMFDKN